MDSSERQTQIGFVDKGIETQLALRGHAEVKAI
jgi:hypothetical protein